MKLVASNDSELSFRDFTTWNFRPSGDYSADNATGRRLAREFLQWRFDSMFNPALGWIVSVIAKQERGFGALEVGFFSALSTELANAELADPAISLKVIQGGRE